MSPEASEWLNLGVRWTHVFAGILWIGQTYYFTWLDGWFDDEEKAAGARKPQVWMLHSGGFYVVEKEKALGMGGPHTSNEAGAAGSEEILGAERGGPRTSNEAGAAGSEEILGAVRGRPRTSNEAGAAGSEEILGAVRGRHKLHRFRWESLTTWVSGMILLVLVYYLGGAMVDSDVAPISTSTAIWIGVGALVVGWTVYDLLYRSPLGRHERAAGAISFFLLVALGYGLTHVLSGRAAYIHIGALLGTIMAANVWMRILPAQRRMLAAIQAGTPPDLREAEQAKRRTRHNTFMVVPLVFLMISSHFPTATYGRENSWLILAGLLLAGGIAARILRRV